MLRIEEAARAGLSCVETQVVAADSIGDEFSVADIKWALSSMGYEVRDDRGSRKVLHTPIYILWPEQKEPQK